MSEFYEPEYLMNHKYNLVLPETNREALKIGYTFRLGPYTWRTFLKNFLDKEEFAQYYNTVNGSDIQVQDIDKCWIYKDELTTSTLSYLFDPTEQEIDTGDLTFMGVYYCYIIVEEN